MTPEGRPPPRTPDAVALGDYLRQQRQAAGLSLRQLAATTGVSHSYLSRVEYGDYLRPAPDALHRVALALGVDHADLFALAGYTPPETLPTFTAYLAAKYDMPDQARDQLRALFHDIQTRHPVHERDATPPHPPHARPATPDTESAEGKPRP